ncbi:AsmA family protein, partial [Methylobacterium crusticola]
GGEPGPAASLAFTCRAPGAAAAALAGSADAAWRGAVLTLSRLSGTLGRNRFTGAVLADLAAKPFLRLDLGFETLALAAGPPGASWRQDLTLLRLVDGRVLLRAADLAAGEVRLTGAALDARIADGTLEATLAPAGFYGGRVQGRLTTAVPASPAEAPRHALRVEITRARGLALLSAAAGFTLLDGATSATLDLRGAGRTPAEALPALAGEAALQIENGRLAGIDIPAVVQSLAARVGGDPRLAASDTTAFDRISARFQLRDGQAATRDLALTGPLVTASGSGTVDLAERAVSLRIEPKLTRAAARSLPRVLDLTVPVLINGAWDAPQVHVDLAGLLGDNDLASGLGALGTELLDALLPGAGRPPPGPPGPPARSSPPR